MSVHMVVSTHNPESCGFRGEHEDEILRDVIERFRGFGGGDSGITIQGFWISRSVHEFFILADAPDAHVLEDAVVESGLVGRTHTRILPVNEVQAVLDAEYQHA
jgi:hypothetical protein